MTKVIEKGEEAAESLMREVEALFEMDVAQRECVERAVEEATDPESREWTYGDFFEVASLLSCKISGQPIEAENNTDGEGCPDGGWLEGPGLHIRWQRGKVEPDGEGDAPWNGCFLVTLLEAAKHQLEYYQGTKFNCPDNAHALKLVETAIGTLNNRQIERFVRGVRGSHEE